MLEIKIMSLDRESLSSNRESLELSEWSPRESQVSFARPAFRETSYLGRRENLAASFMQKRMGQDQVYFRGHQSGQMANNGQIFLPTILGP